MGRRLALGLLVAVGCSNNFDSLYERTDAGAGADGGGVAGHSTKEPLPNLPALPNTDYVDTCTRCAQETCATTRNKCMDDDACIDELYCKGVSNNPAALQTCSARFGWSPWYADYANCVFSQCPSECNAGRNFECAGAYDWPSAPAETPSFAVEFRFETAPTLFLGYQVPNDVSGQIVRACPDNETCGVAGAVDSAEVGVDVRAKLRLAAAVLRPKDFRGYLEFEELKQLVYLAPLARSQVYWAGFLQNRLGTIRIPYDSDRARVDAAALDCLMAPVAGARLSLPAYPDVPVQALQTDLTFAPGPTSGVGFATLAGLPDSAADEKVVVRATLDDGDVPIAQGAVWVRPGWATFIMLTPPARSD